MVSGLSDHSPLVLRSEVDTTQGGRPFKFFYHMAEHKDFDQVVQEGWDVPIHGHAMYRMWGKLKHVKSGLKNLHNKEFANLDVRIEQLRGDLESTRLALVGSGTDSTLQSKERDLMGTLKKFLSIQESAYK